MTAFHNELLDHILEIPDFPKKGVSFKDITPLLYRPQLLKGVIAHMAEFACQMKSTHIIGIESRGYFFALPLALELGLPFIPARKKGKLPSHLVESEEYALEYGKDALEIKSDVLLPHSQFLIVDDVLATGGTANALGRMLLKKGCQTPHFAFFIELTFLEGRAALKKQNPLSETTSLLRY